MAQYQPNSGNDWEYPGHPHTPAFSQSHWRSPDENEVGVQLRRCAQPLPDTAFFWRKTGRPLRVPPLELEIAQPLPDICVRHGRPAVSRRRTTWQFYDTATHPRHPRLTMDYVAKGYFSPKWQQPAPVSTLLVGEWPVCDRCVSSGRGYEWFARILLGVICGGVLVFLLSTLKFDYPPVVSGLVMLLTPIALFLTLLISSKGGNQVTRLPIDDERLLRIRVHPNFRAALQHIPAPPPQSGQPAPHFRMENGRVIPDRPA